MAQIEGVKYPLYIVLVECAVVEQASALKAESPFLQTLASLIF